MSNRLPNSRAVDDYIASYPDDVQEILQKIRRLIRELAPTADESISCGVPAYKLNGKALIYFAAFKKHISVYPAPRGAEPFRDELAGYKGGKGTVQFPLNEAIPFDLVERITRYRITENEAAAATKQATKPLPSS